MAEQQKKLLSRWDNSTASGEVPLVVCWIVRSVREEPTRPLYHSLCCSAIGIEIGSARRAAPVW